MKKIGIYIIKQIKAIWAFFRAKGKPWYRKIMSWTLFWLLLFILYIPAVEFNFLGLFGYSPSIYELQNPEQSIASEIYASNGELIGKFFYENRSPVTYSELSPLLINTLIATEDTRFYLHHGVDFKSMPSVMKDALKGNARGGSTITQQLVKNLYKTRDKSHGLLGKIPYARMFFIKTKEWISALKIELYLSKEEILVQYFNTVDFGSNSFGIKTAAKTFYNKKPSELTAPECAMLIAVLKAPTAYSPILNPERALKRRNLVLYLMKRNNVISQQDYIEFIKLPLNLQYNVEKSYDGVGNYYRQAVKTELQTWLKENNFDLFSSGLKIYTTLDYKMQLHAEDAITKNMQRLQTAFYEHWQGENPWINRRKEEIPNFIENVVKQSWYYNKLNTDFKGNKDSIDYYLHKKYNRKLFSWNGEIDTVCSYVEATNYLKRLLHAGFVAVNPETGGVSAYVGGINFNHFKHDNVLSKRQPGSTFKAFVYAAAFENGWAPCDSIVDKSITVNYVENGEAKSWTPHNADWENVNGNVTLKYAFAHSLNTVSVQLSQDIGVQKLVEFAHKLGIKSDLDTLPSLCLGTSEVSLLELTTAYSAFLNGGYAVEPYFITRIEDNNGKLLAEFKPQKKKVLSDVTVFLMQQLFLGTMSEPYGTTQALYGYDLFNYNTDFGGKTGTSSNYSDGWFVGVTPKLVAGSWVGAEERSVHFRTSKLGEGNKTALPAYAVFMETVLADSSFNYLHARFKRYKSACEGMYECRTPKIEKDTIPEEYKLPDLPDDMIIPDIMDIPRLRGK